MLLKKPVASILRVANHEIVTLIPFKWFNYPFMLQVRSLRLRLQKTKRTGEAEYNITCVQEDHTEIYLSKGKIYVDLLQTQKTGRYYQEICFIPIGLPETQERKIERASHSSLAETENPNIFYNFLCKFYF